MQNKTEEITTYAKYEDFHAKDTYQRNANRITIVEKTLASCEQNYVLAKRDQGNRKEVRLGLAEVCLWVEGDVYS